MRCLLKLGGFGVLHLWFVHSNLLGRHRGYSRDRVKAGWRLAKSKDNGVYFLACEFVWGTFMPNVGSLSGLNSANFTWFKIR